VWVQGRAELWAAPGQTLALVDRPDGTWRFDGLSGEHLSPTGDVETFGVDWFTGRPLQPTLPCDWDGDGAAELLDAAIRSSSGQLGPPTVTFRDPATGVGSQTLDVPAGFDATRYLIDFVCVDLDDDGIVEGVGLVAPTSQVVRWNHDGTVRDVLDPARGGQHLERFAVGQYDGDPSAEIVLPDRSVLDLSTDALDDVLANGIAAIQLYDIDGDGLDERLQLRAGAWEVADDDGTLMWRASPGDGGAYVGDADGDGVPEVVLTDDGTDGWADTRIVEATTGQLRLPPVRTRDCDALWPMDPDGDGISDLFCDTWGSSQQAIEVDTGRVRHERGNGTTAQWPMAGDLDGDGTTEVVWASNGSDVQDRIVVRAADGAWLDLLPLVEVGRLRVAVLDVDGDGADEILLNLRPFSWSPGAGFVEQPPLLPTAQDLDCVRDVRDVDRDGAVDVLFDTCNAIADLYWVSSASGARTDLGTVVAQEPAQFVDLDRDGTYEILTARTSGTHVFDLAGNVLARHQGTGWTLVPRRGRPIVASGALRQVDLLRFDGRRLQQLQRVVLPGRAAGQLHWADDRLWFEWQRDLRGWSPFDGSLVTLETPMPGGPLAIADGYVWVPNQSATTFGYALP
jgi:hypothetical protein